MLTKLDLVIAAKFEVLNSSTYLCSWQRRRYQSQNPSGGASNAEQLALASKYRQIGKPASLACGFLKCPKLRFPVTALNPDSISIASMGAT